MKKTFFGILLCVSVLLVIGIVGGVEQGEPITNMLWCIPVSAVGYVSAVALNYEI